KLEDLPQVTTATADVTDWVRARRGGVDVVVLDPPRNGAGPELMRLLAAQVRQRIVYVSCEPSTLARDLAAIEREGWKHVDLRAFDLFPHTHYVESVTVLERATTWRNPAVSVCGDDDSDPGNVYARTVIRNSVRCASASYLTAALEVSAFLWNLVVIE